MFEAPEPAELGALLSGYDVTELVAVGGMGAVYRAQQVSLGREVAIKVLPRELSTREDFAKSFKGEALAMAKLTHVNLIAVYDFGEVEGMLYLVMEFIDGDTLHDAAHGQVVDPLQAAEIVAGAAAGLGQAHRRNILHRDIKPANIFLTQNLVPKLGDFGLAVSIDDVGSGLQMGTPGYAAPEIFEDFESATPASDVFSLGMILYQLLTGIIPTGEEPANLEHVPKMRGLPDLLQKAIHSDPKRRFPNGESMHKALVEWRENAHKLPVPVAAGRARSTLTAPVPAHARSGPAVRVAQPVRSSGGGEGGKLTVAILATVVFLGLIAFVIAAVNKKQDETGKPATTPEPEFYSNEPDEPDAKPFDLAGHKLEYQALLKSERNQLISARRGNGDTLRTEAGDNPVWGAYFALVDRHHQELPRYLGAEDGVAVTEDMTRLIREYALVKQDALDRAHRKAIERLHQASLETLRSEEALPEGDAIDKVEDWMEWLGADPLEVLAVDLAGSWELWLGPESDEGLHLHIDRKGTATVAAGEQSSPAALSMRDGTLKITREHGSRHWDLRWRISWLEGETESGTRVRFRRMPARFVAAATPGPADPPPIAGTPDPVGDPPDAVQDAGDPEPPLEDKELLALRTEFRKTLGKELGRWFEGYRTRVDGFQKKARGEQLKEQCRQELARIDAMDWKEGYLAPRHVRGAAPVPRDLESVKAKFEENVVKILIDVQADYLADLRRLLARHEAANKDSHELEEEMKPFLQNRRVDLTAFYNAQPRHGAWTRTSAHNISGALRMHHSEHSGIIYDAGGILQLNSGRYRSGRADGGTIGDYYNNDWPLSVPGIPVYQKASSIHVLGASLWVRAEEGTTVGWVVVHYEDGSKEKLVLKDRDNTGDWDKGRDLQGASRIWRGPDGQAVYDIKFENPNPGDVITSIDLESAKDFAGPFFLAITLGP